MEDMEDKYNIIRNESLLIKPFSCFLGCTKLPMDDIFKKSNQFKENINEFKLLGKSYCFTFSKISENECDMNIFLNNNLKLKMRLYYEPITLNLENLNLSEKSVLLYSNEQVKEMIYLFKSKYKFFIQENQTLEEGDNFDTLKEINIEKKLDFDINNETFLDLKNNLKQTLKIISENENEILEIDPLYLSFNFHEIFPEQLGTKAFKLILNHERKNFLEKLNTFIASKDKYFLWIIGSDGIGKTVSLMYHTLINGGNSFYINLKLLKKNRVEIKNIFVNEIIRFFYFKNKEYVQSEFMNFENEIEYILTNIFKLDDKEYKIEQKYKFWIFLKNLISELSRIFKNIQLTIIIDQYRDISADNDYQYINSFLKFIYKKNHKIILSTSINNYEFQSDFFNNVNTINFILNNDEEEESSIDYDLIEEKDDNKDNYEILQECEFYEKFLIKKEYKNMIKKTNETLSVESKFILNNEFKDNTLKIFYSNLVSGKILQIDFEDEEKKCFQNFNYNLKYINKFIKYKYDVENGLIKDEINKENEEKNILKLLNQETQKKIKEKNNKGQNSDNNIQDLNDNNNKEQNNNFQALNNNEDNNINNQGINNNKDPNSNNQDLNNNTKALNNNKNGTKNTKEDIIKIQEKIKDNSKLKIINNFYEYCYNHITSKIENFYSAKEKSDFIKDTNIYEYEKLKELRDTVYNQDFLNIKQLRYKMSYYPGKYLNIINKNFILENNIFYPQLEKLQIKYSNRFFKMTLNEFLSRIEDQMDISTNKKGSGAGIDFEKKVINSIIFNKSQVFGQYNYKKRVIFSLVGKTTNSELTVKKHREEENTNYLYDFYNIKEYSDYIDDIDPIEPYTVKRDINLEDNLYLIIQVSKTGRSFDFVILKKVDNNWYLYLFQVTINKTGELKTKNQYISDSVYCESYLESLYKIKIEKVFLIFIVPFDSYEEKFIKELENRNIYYIFFQLGSFYDKERVIINNFNFFEAELIEEKLNESEKIQKNLQKSLEAWDRSVHNFIRRKRKNEKLYKFYKRNLSSIGGKGTQLILESEMKNKIIDALYNNKKIINEEYELLFIQNCKFSNVEKVSKQNNLLIFFKINNKSYFYFEKYYQLTNDSFSIIAQKPTGTNLKNFKYEKKKINLNEINESSNLCFCFTLLGENII